MDMSALQALITLSNDLAPDLTVGIGIEQYHLDRDSHSANDRFAAEDFRVRGNSSKSFSSIMLADDTPAHGLLTTALFDSRVARTYRP